MRVLDAIREAFASGVGIVVDEPGDHFDLYTGFLVVSGRVAARRNVHLTSLSVRLIEIRAVHRQAARRSRREETRLLGELVLPGITLRAGETETFGGVVEFLAPVTAHELRASRGGAVGAVGRIGMMLEARRFRYELVVRAHARGGNGARVTIPLSARR